MAITHPRRYDKYRRRLKLEEEDVHHHGALGAPLHRSPRPIRKDVPRRVVALGEPRNRVERENAQALGQEHLVACRDAIRVDIPPQTQRRPDRIGTGDIAVVVAAQCSGIVLGQAHEAVRRVRALEQHWSADAEQLSTAVDHTIAVAIQSEERLVAARPDPLDVIGTTIVVDVEVDPYPSGAQLDAIGANVHDDRTTGTPRCAALQGKDENQCAATQPPNSTFHVLALLGRPSWSAGAPGFATAALWGRWCKFHHREYAGVAVTDLIATQRDVDANSLQVDPCIFRAPHIRERAVVR